MKLDLTAQATVELYGLLCATGVSSQEHLKLISDRLYVSLVTALQKQDASDTDRSVPQAVTIDMVNTWLKQQQAKVDALRASEATGATKAFVSDQSEADDVPT